ncbi:MAG: hypothetical protein ACREYE_18760 [Gammaproteobacteria bacterium]
MKKLMLRAVIFSVFGGAAWPIAFGGEVSISEPAEITGTWLLEATASRRDGKRTEENFEWDFQKGGRLVTRGYNYVVERVMTVEDSYQIIDGKIETGQSGKYAVVEKNEKEMVLKGPFGFYFLTRQ